jgi:hypothetical protein
MGRRTDIFYLAKDYDKKVAAMGKDRLDLWPAIPMFDAREFPSLGWRTSAWSWLIGSPIEVVSGPEWDYAMTLHAEHCVTRIRFQQALVYEDTKRIAKTLGVEHPRVRAGDIIMSTDAVVCRSRSGIETLTATSVKREDDVDKRVVEKFAIEAAYWLERQIELRLKLESKINQTVVSNVQKVWERYDPEDLPCTRDEVTRALEFLDEHVRAALLPYASLCRMCDRATGLEAGTSLAVAHHAVIRHRWPIDFTREIVPHRPLPLLLNPPTTETNH